MKANKENLQTNIKNQNLKRILLLITRKLIIMNGRLLICKSNYIKLLLRQKQID